MDSFELITAYRARTFRVLPELRLKNREDAVDFVNQSGFVYFWPITGITLPSLWTAVAGNRPVADAHDDPGHITWDWKDSLLGKGVWYYGRVLHHRNAMLSLQDLPYFYALSPNYGDPEQDYLDQYEQGQMTLEAKTLYSILLRDGPLDTLSLRRAANFSNTGSETRFNRALDLLQAEFKVLPVGVSQAGAWRYAFIYDLTHRCFPRLMQAAQSISENAARDHLVLRYLRLVGAIQPSAINKLFGWTAPILQKVLARLEKSSQLSIGIQFSDQPGEWVLLTQMDL